MIRKALLDFSTPLPPSLSPNVPFCSYLFVFKKDVLSGRLAAAATAAAMVLETAVEVQGGGGGRGGGQD